IRVAGQRACDGEHLLLAAGETAPALMPALAQHGKVLEDARERPARVRAVGPRGQAQVLADVEMRKDLPPLGYVAHAQPKYAMRRIAGDVAIPEAHDA